MSKKWISLLLAVMMLLGLAVPAFAEGEQEAPPTAEIVEEAPQAEEAPPASDEAAPAEDAVIEETVVEEAPAEEVTNDDGIMPISDEPMTVAAGGVTVNVTGPTDGVHRIIYPGMDGPIFRKMMAHSITHLTVRVKMRLVLIGRKGHQTASFTPPASRQ